MVNKGCLPHPAGEYLDEIGENPALELILISDLNFVEDIFYRHYRNKSYAEGRNIIRFPNWYLYQGSKHSNPEIREYIAENTCFRTNPQEDSQKISLKSKTNPDKTSSPDKV